MTGRPTRQAWLIVGGGFIAFTVSASLMHAYTVFLLAFVQDFGWSRADASLAYSVGQIIGGVSSPLVGGLVDRLGARRMVLLGGCLLTAGLLFDLTGTYRPAFMLSILAYATGAVAFWALRRPVAR